MLSLLVCCLAYCGVAVIITLMVPYYDMDHEAPLPVAFKQVGYVVAQWIISIGRFCVTPVMWERLCCGFLVTCESVCSSSHHLPPV